VLLLACSLPARAAELTLDTVYAKEPPWGRMIDRVEWSPDGTRFLYVRRSQDPREALPLMLYDVATGRSRIWVAPSAFHEETATPEVFGWSPDGARVAFSVGGAL
jgi:dipeptidyl aminopeptidase/acylaminoacyl peptidase